MYESFKTTDQSSLAHMESTETGSKEWVRETEREGSPFLRPPLISIKWSPVAVGSIAVCLNLIQADSLTHPSPACMHTHTHTHTLRRRRSVRQLFSLRKCKRLSLLPCCLLPWLQSAGNLPKELTERAREREFGGEEGLRKVKERNVSLLSRRWWL